GCQPLLQPARHPVIAEDLVDGAVAHGALELGVVGERRGDGQEAVARDDVVVQQGRGQPERAEHGGAQQQGEGQEVTGGGHPATLPGRRPVDICRGPRRRVRSRAVLPGRHRQAGPGAAAARHGSGPAPPRGGTGPEGCARSADADEGPAAGVDVALGGVDAGVAGVHELVAARVYADVAGLVDQVAGLGLGARDHSAGSGLAGGAAREVDAELGVDPLDEAGAVPARRGGAAVHVGGADAGAGGGEDRAALGGGRRRCGALLLLLGGGGRGRGRGLLGGLLGRGVVVAAGALLGAGGAVVVLTGLGALIGLLLLLLLLLLGLALGGALSGFALGGLGGGDLLL